MKKRILTASMLIIFLAPGLFFLTAQAEQLPLQGSGEPQNVILLIGDGMGLIQSYASRLQTQGQTRFSFERMPVTGLMETYSANQLITDSAAAATAMATGHKTDNGMISMLPDGKPVPTIIEYLRSKGLSCGVVATSSMTHATPAGFSSHALKRKQEFDIASSMLETAPEVMLGGGWNFFLPSDKGGKRTDGRDLLEEATEAGYTVLQDTKKLGRIKSGKLLGLFAPEAMTGNKNEPSLQDMTEQALTLLSSDKDGFFLMVEGSQIDWACHANDPVKMTKDIVEFDRAVQTALDFAKKKRNTLVVVTADHETGGLTINAGELDGSGLGMNWASDYHTPSPVIIYAYGPGDISLTGMINNTDLPSIIVHLLGQGTFPKK